MIAFALIDFGDTTALCSYIGLYPARMLEEAKWSMERDGLGTTGMNIFSICNERETDFIFHDISHTDLSRFEPGCLFR